MRVEALILKLPAHDAVIGAFVMPATEQVNIPLTAENSLHG